MSTLALEEKNTTHFCIGFAFIEREARRRCLARQLRHLGFKAALSPIIALRRRYDREYRRCCSHNRLFERQRQVAIDEIVYLGKKWETGGEAEPG